MDPVSKSGLKTPKRWLPSEVSICQRAESIKHVFKADTDCQVVKSQSLESLYLYSPKEKKYEVIALFA